MDGANGDTPATVRVEVASATDAGDRLDVFLARRLVVSRARVRGLLEAKRVESRGRKLVLTAKGTPVAAGDRYEILEFRPPGEERIRPAGNLAVVASGPGWVAVDKPPGVPVHPYREDEEGTVLNALVARMPEIQGVGEAGLRSGVVHRLDVDTSGVLLVATAEATWMRLRSAFREHRVEKVYRAMVHGRVDAPQNLRLGLRVGRHRPARVDVVDVHRAASDSSVRETTLELTPLVSSDAGSLVEVRPSTGFLHQIRASLAHIAHPVVGDRLYGPDRDVFGAERHMLHAARVRFEEVAAHAPDPADFERAWEAIQRS